MYDIEEALTAVGAAALVQKRIDPLVNELQRRYSPLLEAIPAEPWNSTVFNWDARTQLPSGGSTTDGGTRPVTSSTYIQTPVTIRNMLTVGAVTGYAEAVTQTFGSLRGREIMGAVKGLNWDVETLLTWGNSAATQFGPYPQFDGMDTLCSRTTGSNKNTIDCSGINSGNFELAIMDLLIDLVEGNISESIFSDDWFFVCSPTVESRIAQLLIAQQRFNNLPTAEIGAGLVVMAYRDIPLVKSSWLNARDGAMSTIAATQATTGGSIDGGSNRYYRVTAILPRSGESAPSNELHVTVAGSTGSTATNIVTLTFTPPTTNTGAPVLAYKVYESATTGTEVLLGVVDGVVGLMSDNVTPIVTTSIVDTGTALVPQNGSTVPASSPSVYVGGGLGSLPVPVATGQNIYLMSRDPANIVRPYVRNVQPVPNLAPTVLAPDQMPYALVTDTALGLRMDTFIARAYNTKVALAS
jgi:hypothetical protein